MAQPIKLDETHSLRKKDLVGNHSLEETRDGESVNIFVGSYTECIDEVKRRRCAK